jgi:4-amino-4-deoxy-L-arabinose transferase-like glycosyltransferase
VRAAWRGALAALALYFLYFHGLSQVGLIGPDEPRYASIGRDMMLMGDWLTPRLWGEAWFEKPPLEYWGIALAYTVGLDDDLAPRAFNALLGAGFLVFFWFSLRRLGFPAIAWPATAMLATSVAWLAESRIAVMDLPLAVLFGGAMLALMCEWFVAAAALLALSVLAKGLVPIVLALPALWFYRRHWRHFALPAIVFLVLAQPWFIYMTIAHGRAFVDEFFIKHHFSRFTASALQHVQPFWFFVPVLAAGLFPWTPLLGLLRWPREDSRQQFLFVWAAWGFLFFSISRNKLPGYILPVIPPLVILIALAVEASRRKWAWYGACGALCGLAALVPAVLPAALADGLSRARVDLPVWPAVLIGMGALTMAAWQGWRAVALIMTVFVPLLVAKTFPALDERVSARTLWKVIEGRRAIICTGDLHRSWRYGLNFYSVEPLPACDQSMRPIRLTQQGTQVPEIQAAPQITFPGPAANPDPDGASPPAWPRSAPE